jgi:hypothetical protein
MQYSGNTIRSHCFPALSIVETALAEFSFLDGPNASWAKQIFVEPLSPIYRRPSCAPLNSPERKSARDFPTIIEFRLIYWDAAIEIIALSRFLLRAQLTFLLP